MAREAAWYQHEDAYTNAWSDFQNPFVKPEKKSPDEAKTTATPATNDATDAANTVGLSPFDTEAGTVSGTTKKWSYEEVREIILRSGSKAGRDFIDALEKAGIWVYGFDSLRVLQARTDGMVWTSTGTAERWIWTGPSYKGVEPTDAKRLPYLASLPDGIYINNSLTSEEAVETFFHEAYHMLNPSASEGDVRVATTQFMIDIGLNKSMIPGAITTTTTASGTTVATVNTAATRASAPPYTTAISTRGTREDNIKGFNGMLPTAPPPPPAPEVEFPIFGGGAPYPQ